MDLRFFSQCETCRRCAGGALQGEEIRRTEISQRRNTESIEKHTQVWQLIAYETSICTIQILYLTATDSKTPLAKTAQRLDDSPWSVSRTSSDYIQKQFREANTSWSTVPITVDRRILRRSSGIVKLPWRLFSEERGNLSTKVLSWQNWTEACYSNTAWR
jgi:hypothetical protein